MNASLTHTHLQGERGGEREEERERERERERDAYRVGQALQHGVAEARFACQKSPNVSGLVHFTL